MDIPVVQAQLVLQNEWHHCPCPQAGLLPAWGNMRSSLVPHYSRIPLPLNPVAGLSFPILQTHASPPSLRAEGILHSLTPGFERTIFLTITSLYKLLYRFWSRNLQSVFRCREKIHEQLAASFCRGTQNTQNSLYTFYLTGEAPRGQYNFLYSLV